MICLLDYTFGRIAFETKDLESLRSLHVAVDPVFQDVDDEIQVSLSSLIGTQIHRLVLQGNAIFSVLDAR